MAMKVSREGQIFVMCREAVVLTAYPDGGNPSVGMGHNDPNLTVGQVITIKQAFDWFKEDVAKWEASLNRALKAPISQQQFDAIFSLHHQSGYRYMPAVVALCNAKEFAVAAALFPLCDRNKAGQQLNGLHKRRVLERAVFESSDYGDLTAIPFWSGDPHTTGRETYTLQPGDI